MSGTIQEVVLCSITQKVHNFRAQSSYLLGLHIMKLSVDLQASPVGVQLQELSLGFTYNRIREKMQRNSKVASVQWQGYSAKEFVHLQSSIKIFFLPTLPMLLLLWMSEFYRTFIGILEKKSCHSHPQQTRTVVSFERINVYSGNSCIYFLHYVQQFDRLWTFKNYSTRLGFSGSSNQVRNREF